MKPSYLSPWEDGPAPEDRRKTCPYGTRAREARRLLDLHDLTWYDSWKRSLA
jgi:hypothetical protein